MPEQNTNGTAHIEKLLESIQEPRSVQSRMPPRKPAIHRHRAWIWIVVAAILTTIAGALLISRQRTARLNIRSFPSNGTVVLDGQLVGTTPLVLANITPGAHTIQIRLPGWEEWSGTTTAVRGATTQIIANLKHAVYGLSITSTPSGATVTLDGTVKGVTPLTVTGLKPRNYDLTISLKGYASVERTVDLSDAAQTAQDFSLREAFGKISITSDPTGADVSLDGTSYGVTPFNNDHFPVGTYNLKLTMAEAKDIVDTISVTEGTTLTKHYAFELALGSLSIITEPAGAFVTIDGKATGLLTPCTITGLNEGAHTVSLTLAGYLPWSNEISVAGGATSQLNISLTKMQ